MWVKPKTSFNKIVSVSALALATSAMTAWAQSAPIVYKGSQSSRSYTQPATRSYSSPRATTTYNQTSQSSYSRSSNTRQTNTTGVSRAERRINFQYPGASASTSTSRQYAHAGTTYSASSRQVNDPVLLGRDFDGQATAGRIQARRSLQGVDEVGLAPVATVGEGSAYTTVASARSVTSPVAGPAFNETGYAVIYDDAFNNQPTANGEMFLQTGMTAAHPSLPLPSLVQVVNIQSGQEIVVRVNDRGPFEDNASIQLSKKAANLLQFGPGGRGQVEVRYLGPAPVAGQMPQLVDDVAAVDSYADVELAGAPLTETPTRVPTSAPQSLSFGTGLHFVQVGAFSDLGNAQALSDALSSGLPVKISQAVVNGTDFFRVRVGPMETETLAETMRNHLAEQGIANGRVVRDDQ